MISNPPCPACNDDAWQNIGSSRFCHNASDRTDYERLRDRLLFELWAPGTQDFVATFNLCSTCGFVGFVPRPSAEDMQAKYDFLSKLETRAPRNRDLDTRRSEELLAWVSRYRRGYDGALLDLGGGRGELLSAFVAAGFEACVLDFPSDPEPGIRWCGSSFADMPPNQRFSAVLASHVFEHLADPVEVARQVLGHLAPGGTFFVEVPLEILGGIPRMREPVTHVNFFCAASLSTLLERAGFEVMHRETVASLFASGAHRYAVRVVARRPLHAITEAKRYTDAREARWLLTAGRLGKLIHAVRMPKVLLPRVGANATQRRAS